jgi:phosphoadenosine phosphosulfate reductase
MHMNENKMGLTDLETVNAQYAGEGPEKLIRKALAAIGPAKIALASSLSIEDQVLTDILLKACPEARIFFIDTGRHFQKTYDLMAETMKRYDFHYEVYAPESRDLEELVAAYGPNLFYDHVELRKKCCEVRKVKPLKRVLSTVDAWICGLRREQSPTREQVDLWEWDGNHALHKINPLAFWNEEQVWAYIQKENVPYSNLYRNGFRSVGCQPCTRAVRPGEDVRSGRWWWESPDKKECGLHPAKIAE